MCGLTCLQQHFEYVGALSVVVHLYHNRECPLSNLDITKAWTKVAAVSSSKTLRI